MTISLPAFIAWMIVFAAVAAIAWYGLREEE